jgi:hypothetical protein
VLVRIGERAVESLIATLADPSTNDRAKLGIAQVLARIGGPAIRPLLDSLAHQQALIKKRDNAKGRIRQDRGRWMLHSSNLCS